MIKLLDLPPPFSVHRDSRLPSPPATRLSPASSRASPSLLKPSAPRPSRPRSTRQRNAIPGLARGTDRHKPTRPNSSWKGESEWKEFVSWSPLRYDVHENYFTPSTRNSSDK